jgi:hypothetical protein
MHDGRDAPTVLPGIFFEVDEMVAVERADSSHSRALPNHALQDGSL